MSLFTIEHITECCDEWDIVTFSGKAVHIGETETTIAKKLKLAKSRFVDKTGIIDLDLWEQFIEHIKRGSVYEVSSAQVRIWNGKKKLSTTLRSTVTKVRDNSLAQLSFSPGKLRTSIISNKSKWRIFTQFTKCKEISLRQLF